MFAVVCELNSRHELRVSEHGCHTPSRVVIEDAERLVGTGGGSIDPAPVQGNLDERAILAGGALESPENQVTKLASNTNLLKTPKNIAPFPTC